MFDKIEVDYDQLGQISQQFENRSQTVQHVLHNVHSKMSVLQGGGWEGRGSDAFFTEMQGEVLPAVQRLQQALEEAGRMSKGIIQTMQQAEEEASSPFKA